MIGAPGDTVSGRDGAGSVVLLQGRSRPSLLISQSTKAVPGSAETGDGFGTTLAFGHHSTTLLVGIPGEDVGRTRDAGAVQPVGLGSTRALRFPAAITENAPGRAGSVRTGNRFGKALGSLSGRTEDILTVSSPYAAGGSVYVLSDGDGVRPRSWKPGAGASRFGWSVSN